VRRTRASLAAAVLIAAAASPLHAQEVTPKQGDFTVLMFGGGSAYTRLQNVTVADTMRADSFPARLALSTTTTVGLGGSFWFRDWLALRVTVSYAPTHFTLRMEEADRDSLLGPDAGTALLRFSDASVYTFATTAEFAMPSAGKRVAPYLLMGAGAVTFTVDDQEGSTLADEVGSGRTDLAAMLGAGMRVRLQGNRVSLAFELTDHFTRSPVPANTGRTLATTDELVLINRSHPAASDDSASYVHDVTFAAGLVFRP